MSVYAQILQTDATSKLRTNDVNYQEAGSVLANWRRPTCCAMLIAFLSRYSWIINSCAGCTLQATAWCEVETGGDESSFSNCFWSRVPHSSLVPDGQNSYVEMFFFFFFLTLCGSVLQCIICICKDTVTSPGLLAP